MIELSAAANLAAMISAVCDVTAGVRTFADALKRHKQDPQYRDRGRKLRAALSTFSDAEVRAIEKRIKGCQDRFIKEGNGPWRISCLSSVLSDVRAGNNGLEDFPEWQATYDQLKCG